MQRDSQAGYTTRGALGAGARPASARRRELFSTGRETHGFLSSKARVRFPLGKCRMILKKRGDPIPLSLLLRRLGSLLHAYK